MARVNISSDGTPGGTHVTVGGERVAGIQRLVWEADIHGTSLLHITVKRSEVEFNGEIEVEVTPEAPTPPRAD